MSAKTKSAISFVLVFSAIVAGIVAIKWDDWSEEPIQALYWTLEVLVIIGLSLLLAPLTFRVIKALLWVYLAVGTKLARLVLGNRAGQASEKGQTQEEFLNKPIFQIFLKWMRFGKDRESVDRALTPEELSGWIVAAWPLAILPLIFEEMLPFFLFPLGLAPFAGRQMKRRKEEVANVVEKTFTATVSDSSG